MSTKKSGVDRARPKQRRDAEVANSETSEPLHQNNAGTIESDLDESEASSRRFAAEAAYADSMFRGALGDWAGAVESLERALEFDPGYGPAILGVGSVEYQRDRKKKGRLLLFSLLDLPDGTEDLIGIIDHAGEFLIERREYADGLDLYRRAVDRFPREVELFLGLSCCASHEGRLEESLAASQRAVELAPDDPGALNDLGWSLHELGRDEEARAHLERAVALDPQNKLARKNLRRCRNAIKLRTAS